MNAENVDLNTRRQSLISVGANILIISQVLAVAVILESAFGIAGVGIYYLTKTISYLIAQPASGVGSVIRKRGSETGEDPSKYFGGGLLATGVYLLLVFVVVIVFADSVFEFFGLPVWVLGPFLFLTFNSSVEAQLMGYYSATGHPGSSHWYWAIRDVLFFIGLLFLMSVGAAVETVLYYFAGVTLLVLLLGGVYIRAVPQLPTKRILIRCFTYAKWAIPAQFVGILIERMPVLLLGIIAGPSAVGLYEVANKLTTFGAYIGTCMRSPLHIRVSGRTSVGISVKEEFRQLVAYSPVLAFPLVFIFAAVPHEILTVTYGPELAAAAVTLILVGIGRFLYTIRAGIGSGLKGSNMPRPVFLSLLFVGALSIPVGAYLITEWESEGGALLLVFMELSLTLLYLIPTIREFSWEYIPFKRLRTQTLGGILTAGILWGLNEYVLPLATVGSLIGYISVGLVVYYALITALNEDIRQSASRSLAETEDLLRDVIP